ncbi:hypothetical protein C8R43DRAFT_1127154 [Mycena crocata]|nr:hypothetical protein C8R43DRAFT_1127154 [Mycena crocata]
MLSTSPIACLAALALAGVASAAISTGGLKILAPGGPDLWWLKDQDNNVVWTCGESTFTQFTLTINNPDTKLLTDSTALIAVEQNFNCAQTVAATLFSAPLGTGYFLRMANILNSTDIYAESDPFEIKALSAGYPLASATPVDTASATVSKGSASNQIAGQTSSAGAPGASQTGAAMSGRVVSTLAAGAGVVVSV